MNANITVPNCHLFSGFDSAGNYIQALVPFGEMPDEKHFGADWNAQAPITQIAVVHAAEIRRLLGEKEEN